MLSLLLLLAAFDKFEKPGSPVTLQITEWNKYAFFDAISFKRTMAQAVIQFVYQLNFIKAKRFHQ